MCVLCVYVYMYISIYVCMYIRLCRFCMYVYYMCIFFCYCCGGFCGCSYCCCCLGNMNLASSLPPLSLDTPDTRRNISCP